MTSEAQYLDDLVVRLHETFGRVETEVTLQPSGNRCDILVESPSGNRYALEVADELTWGDPTQARFYGDQLSARPVVAVPPGGADLDELLPIATSGEVTILPIQP